MEHRESCREHFERAHYPGAYDEQRFCTAVRSIDTVKALHQTVVSLRTALDESRQEIDKLKKQITVNSEIQDAKHQQHILEESTDQTAQNINFQTLSNKVSELEKLYQDNKSKSTSVADDEEIPTKKTADDFKQSTVRKSTKFESSVKNDTTQTISLKPDITFSTNPSTSGATGANNWNSTMASRIDVKIKVSSNINIDDTDTTDTSEISDSPKPEDESHEESREEPSNADDLETPKQEQNPTIQIIDEDSANTFTVEGSNVIIKVCFTQGFFQLRFVS